MAQTLRVMQTPPTLHDEIIKTARVDIDLSIQTFIERVVETFNSRMLFWDIFA